MKKNITLFLLLLFAFTIVRAQQSENITFMHDGKIVYGTFTSPNGTGKFPIIIISPGSGAIDRDGTIPFTDGNSACLFPDLFGDTLRVYKELGDAFVDSGYAVLRYDKLEFTYPTTLGTITFHKLWLPVESAINYIKTRSDVDTNRIILVGHSEGSSLIPFIAKGRHDIKALISIAGASTPFDSLLAWQFTHLVSLLTPCGATAADSLSAVNQSNQVLSYFNVIRTNTWNGSTPSLFGVPASAWYDYIIATDNVAINYNIDNLPTLFTGMGLDIQVPPSELIRFENEVTITNDFWSMPGLIHDMTPIDDPHVATALSDTIIYWLRQHNLFSGINQHVSSENVVATFPNPFHNEFLLVIKNKNASHLSISIKNVLGETIFLEEEFISNDIFKKQFDFNKFINGIYFLEINMDGGKIIRKIIRE